MTFPKVPEVADVLACWSDSPPIDSQTLKLYELGYCDFEPEWEEWLSAPFDIAEDNPGSLIISFATPPVMLRLVGIASYQMARQLSAGTSKDADNFVNSLLRFLQFCVSSQPVSVEDIGGILSADQRKMFCEEAERVQVAGTGFNALLYMLSSTTQAQITIFVTLIEASSRKANNPYFASSTSLVNAPWWGDLLRSLSSWRKASNG